MKKRLFLIDGNSLINRAFYALPPLTDAKGNPTNAIYGLTMMLFRLQDDYDPDQILVAFDVSGPTFRHEEYKEYKANRKGMPDDLRSQIPVMKDLLDKLGICRMELQGYEADDLLGTVAKQGEKEGYEVFIVTGDRDSFQLVSAQTQVLYTKRGITDTETINEASLLKNYGVTPAQVIELKGLMGDSSDNIPGVPGVGEKTALKLLASYNSVQGVYENLAELKGKLKENLTTYKEQAFLSKDLATIRLDVPLEVKLGETSEIDQTAIRQMFEELQFKTLLDRLPSGAESGNGNQNTWESDLELVDATNLPELLQQLDKYQQVFLAWAEKQQTLFIRFEEKTYGLEVELLKEHQEELKTKFKAKELYAVSGKEILHLFKLEGLDAISFDLELALYCLDPEKRWDLAAICQHFQKPLTTVDPKKPDYWGIYLQLYQAIASQIKDELQANELLDLYTDLELPLVTTLARMEADGILVDQVKLAEISQDLEATLAKLTATIYAEAGEEFNINSPKQLGVILFEKLGLPVLKRTKTGPSTSAEVLEELSDHAIVASVLEYRQIAKLKSTYTDSLAELISPQTKRIHTTFNQTVTATGRLSSTHPNLQNIPVRTEEGRRIREAFVAPPGHVLLMADYSQIELRLLAHLSEDEILRGAFLSGQDIHAQTAAEVFGLALAEVSEEERNAAKAINFGIIYGISSFGLAKGINLTRAEAQQYIDSYFLRYPMVKAYLDGLVEQGKQKGYVETLSGRRRYLPNIKSRNFAVRNFAARTAMNTPIQGSAADIIKLAMLKVYRALQAEKLKSKLLLQVHDELVLEVPTEELDLVANLIKKEMEEVYPLSIPLKVGVFYGFNWRDVKSYDFKE